eukprot:1194324-Prorocentrum_minimum.AAC.12
MNEPWRIVPQSPIFCAQVNRHIRKEVLLPPRVPKPGDRPGTVGLGCCRSRVLAYTRHHAPRGCTPPRCSCPPSQPQRHGSHGGPAPRVRADVKGYVVDVKGYAVDVKGHVVDAKGYVVDAERRAGLLTFPTRAAPWVLASPPGVMCFAEGAMWPVARSLDSLVAAWIISHTCHTINRIDGRRSTT